MLNVEFRIQGISCSKIQSSTFGVCPEVRRVHRLNTAAKWPKHCHQRRHAPLEKGRYANQKSIIILMRRMDSKLNIK